MRYIFFLVIIFTFCSSALGNNRPTKEEPEGKAESLDIKRIKKGYNIAPFPEFMIDPVVGVYLGINATMFDFGDGSRYPDYFQFYNLNAAWGTKGKSNLSIRYTRYFESSEKIVSVKLGHTVSNLYPFYGFNGYQTFYNYYYENPNSSDFITSAFYNYKQKKSQFEGYIINGFKDSKLSWKLGLDISYYKISRVDFKRLNKNVVDANGFIDSLTLYDLYKQWDIIKSNEKNGGWANSLLASVLYDSRDRLTNPMKGIYSEITVRYYPSFFNSHSNGLQLGLKYQQYITLIKKRASVAYRLRYDASLGYIAFYQKQVLADGIKGYGGASGMQGKGFGTIWGVKQNRAVGKQMALANIELRVKLFRFRLFKQNWHTALVPIYHTGLILQPYPIDFSNVSAEDQQKYFRDEYKGFYSSVGLGGKLVMNENIVIGLDWAYALNAEAGNNTYYVGLGYTF